MKKLFLVTLAVILLINAPLKSDAPTEKKLLSKQSPDTIEKSVSIHCNPELKFSPYNDNRQTIKINNNDPDYPCLNLYGKQLTECMSSQSKENALKHFKKFSVRTAKYFLMQLSIDEYKEFLQLFSESEWTNYLNQLKPEEQLQMPQTLAEQLNVVDETYMRTYNAMNWGMATWFATAEKAGTENWWKELRKKQFIFNYHEACLMNHYEDLKRRVYKFQK